MRFLTPLDYDIDIRIEAAAPRRAGKVTVRDMRRSFSSARQRGKGP
jgi:hypothetical protein